MTVAPGYRKVLPGLVPLQNGQPACALRCRAVRPLFYLRHPPMAEAAEILAASFPKAEAPPALAGLGVLKDLAWLAALLRDLQEETRAYEPARESLVAFLRQQAPSKANEWLRVSVTDEPLRWSFRLRVAPELGDMLTRLLRSVFAFGDVIDAFGQERGTVLDDAAAAQATAAAIRAELEWAISRGPTWKTRLLAIRSHLPEAVRELS